MYVTNTQPGLLGRLSHNLVAELGPAFDKLMEMGIILLVIVLLFKKVFGGGKAKGK